MPRRNRCVVPGVPCHITQRGVGRHETFSSPQDRATYLRLIRENFAGAGAAVLAYCLMTNYVHLIAIPEREDSLAVLLRRIHGRYAQYCNPRCGRSGSQLWAAIAYVERNPVRAGLMDRPGDCPWSSAAAHLTGADPSGVLDMLWWRHESPAAWAEAIGAKDPESGTSLRRCTYSGRPFGEEEFVREVSRCFGRYWTRGRPPKQPGVRLFTGPGDQFSLFGEPCGKLLSSG